MALKALEICRQKDGLQSMIFHATSLEVFHRLLLSMEPPNLRPLRNHEVDTIHQILTPVAMGQPPISKVIIHNAVCIGRARANLPMNPAFTDEPCLYLLLPHVNRM